MCIRDRLKMKDSKINKRLMMFKLKDTKPGEPLLLHDEPIYLDKKIIGRTTSGNYSFNFNTNLAFFQFLSSDPQKMIPV